MLCSENINAYNSQLTACLSSIHLTQLPTHSHPSDSQTWNGGYGNDNFLQGGTISAASPDGFLLLQELTYRSYLASLGTLSNARFPWTTPASEGFILRNIGVPFRINVRIADTTAALWALQGN
ncbi:hypothetical protein D9758_007576 [Tetrapyrgos nigripes]|uniref:Uncharacterized protein n=1 Tax=Tetrapyrgos nigripes TaxID=182062 RepID=A0A8H5LK23_9AGAR|nr:hypothetical protein D9758_007576 [Tetrapyrgos nigripes]